jgi:pre-mRNA-splicing factor SPF27
MSAPPPPPLTPLTQTLDIEPTPSASLTASIAALISSELPADHSTTLHPSLPALPEPNFSPLISAELDRISSNQPLNGIDLTRYDPAHFPSPTTSADLHAAYTSLSHLSSRLTNLALLNSHGKNAWLIHNAHLESVLKSYEEELMALRTQVEVVNKERKGVQVEVEPELKRLEERWKRAVGRVLEVEVAIEGVRREEVERRRVK